MIGTLRRVLSSALGGGQDDPVSELRKPQPGEARPARPRTQRRRGVDVDRRIDDARRRLKATIPPPED